MNDVDPDEWLFKSAGLTVMETPLVGSVEFTVSVLGDTPVPLIATVCGLPVPLEVTVNVADRAPVVEGVNAMVTVQVAAAANEDVQVFELMVKSPVLIPMTMFVVVALFPVTVIGIGVAAVETVTLLKFTAVGLKLKNGTEAAGTKRSHTPRPWVTARKVRVA